MHWLFLLLALAAVGLAFFTAHMSLLITALLLALLLILLALRHWHARHSDQVRQDLSAAIDPLQLRRLHELPEAHAVPATTQSDLPAQ